nr:hypothetical protein [Cytobacillus firmus]
MPLMHITFVYNKEEFEPYKKRGLRLLNLRILYRQYEKVSLKTLKEFPTSEDVQMAGESK